VKRSGGLCRATRAEPICCAFRERFSSSLSLLRPDSSLILFSVILTWARRILLSLNRIKIIFLATIFALSFAFINCQKDVSPFSPQMDVEKESENATTGSLASTQSKTQGVVFPVAQKNEGGIEADRNDKDDSRAFPGAIANQETGKKGVEAENFSWHNRLSQPTKSHHGKKEIGRDVDTEEDQGLGVQIQPFQMRGPAGTPITPISTELAGFSFIAKFSQRQAITLIPNPPGQEKYQISVSFYLKDGTFHELSCWITLRGKKK